MGYDGTYRRRRLVTEGNEFRLLIDGNNNRAADAVFNVYVGDVSTGVHMLQARTVFPTNNVVVESRGIGLRELGSSSFPWTTIFATQTTFNGVTYTWPGADGSPNQVLTTNSFGGLTWTTPSAGIGGSGTANQVAYFTAATTLASSANFTFDGTTIMARGLQVGTGIATAPGNGNAIIQNGLNVGFDAAPASDSVFIGDSQHALRLMAGPIPRWFVATNDWLQFTRSSNLFEFVVNTVARASVSQTLFSTSVNADIGGTVTLDTSLLMNGSSSGTFTQSAPATVSPSYSVIWPSAQAVGAQFLRNDGAGVLSWATPTAGAPVGSAYVTIGNDGTLTAERALTGTANQVVITDNGANSTVVLSTPQDIATSSSPTFVNCTFTGGIRVGFAGAPTADLFELGDANFHLDYNGGTTPRLLFDSTDYFGMTRSGSTFTWVLGGSTAATLFGADPRIFTINGANTNGGSIVLARATGGAATEGGQLTFETVIAGSAGPSIFIDATSANLRLWRSDANATVTNFLLGFQLSSGADFNLGLFSSSGSFGGGVKVVFIANATTVPTSDPSGGGVLYVTSGALWYRGSSGAITKIAAA